MDTVTAIEEIVGSPRKRVVHVNHMPWRSIPVAVLRESDLSVGAEVDLQGLTDVLAPIETRLARRRALQLASARERTREELSRRLDADGYAEPVVAQTVEALERIGVVSDSRCAEALAHSLVCVRGFGRNRVEREMARRGLAPDTVQAALELLAVEEGEYERAVRCAGVLARQKESVGSLTRRLVRRGYATGVAFHAAEQHFRCRAADD